VAATLDDVGALAPVNLNPALISVSAGFRRHVPIQYPVLARVVPVSGRDAVVCALREFDEPVIVGPDGKYIDSRYWRKVIELDDEEVLLLL